MDSEATSVKHSMEAPRSISVPKLLVELPPRHSVFFGNLRDFLLPQREPALTLTSKPAAFWPDVLISDRLPWRGLADSIAVHVLVLTTIYALALYGFFGRRPQPVRNPFHNTITYYSVSDYLPELNSGSKPAKVELKGQPAYAKQEIISVPPEPDNTRQTIITPWEMRLKRDVPLPNIVAWDAAIPALPMGATPVRKLVIPQQQTVVPPPPEPVRREGAIQLPAELMRHTAVPPPVDPLRLNSKNLAVQTEVVGPTVDPARAGVRDLNKFQPKVVPPAAEITMAKPNLPTITTPSVVEPAANLDQARRRPGALNIANTVPEVAAPNLPVPEQRALGVGQSPPTGGRAGLGGTEGAPSGTGHGGAAQTSQAQAAEATSAPAGSGSDKGSGQLIALNVDPAEVKGPINVPTGTRRGVFAAGPTGTPGAPGTPELHKGGDGTGGSSTSPGAGTGGGDRKILDGVFVGPGTQPSPGGAVVATKPAPAHAPDNAVREKLMAAARPPDLTRLPAPGSTIAQPTRQIEDKVFGAKKYYSLTLNMPNLASSTGSWVIRFAELKQSHDGIEVAAPIAMNKVDPAYPADLVRDKVEGTVVLYAVIHADGTVGEVRVLNGIDDRLDENAVRALARWRFRPGTKNGEAIDLEAVVQIPFRVRKQAF